MNKSLFLIVLLLLPVALFAQKGDGNIRNGNKFYEKEKYVDAEVEYRKGIEKDNKSFVGNFNLGDALYRQGKYAEATGQFQHATEKLEGTDKKKIAASYHNMGNALLKSGNLKESIEAYKQSLRFNPKDDETRANLAYAQSLLQQQEQQQQEQQNQDQQQQNQQQEQNQEQQQQQNQEESNPQQPNSEEMSKENAQQILEALLQDEKDVQEKVKQQQMQQSKRYKVQKDW